MRISAVTLCRIRNKLAHRSGRASRKEKRGCTQTETAGEPRPERDYPCAAHPSSSVPGKRDESRVYPEKAVGKSRSWLARLSPSRHFTAYACILATCTVRT